MPSNRGATSLKRRWRSGDKMREFDRLPAELRAWLSCAALPWGTRSAKRTFARAMARTRDTALALRELDRIEARLIAKDARKIWGEDHPGVTAAPEQMRGPRVGGV